MKINEVREIGKTDLKKELFEQKRSLMNLRFRKSAMQLTDTNELSRVRKNIARIKTVIREREIVETMTDKGKEI
ncbi:MAG: 50S ribosomal protein L29 [SAR202 cluster bacterium]|jgi:large subunit ribosomal protein L29|nr:50S ribosomal protein L29 [Dehalococcoidia bacterium]MDP7232402.1 50S ribosomal protein L29 [Dehalococcoidia bacterium]MDP7613364.1 50S ribosomal protein L29 [Dehalococcoidia bacterium]MQG47028.1 50S ribosomal protein L29 [SAR202 cluster bacterium]|tara:strand:+ start:312 stop:533 length:222 start_codon:yes stop_codon:yes gene_type:complete